MIFYYLVAAASMINAPEVSNSPLPVPPIYTHSPDTKTTPIPLGNPGEWVNSNDYPSGALREEREGIVGFRLEVTTSGRASKCEVTQSSGHLDLDTAVCDLVSQRARFTPAKNKEGRPITGFYYNRVRWALPKIKPIPVPGQNTISFVIEKDGSVSNCKISTTYTDIKNTGKICEQVKDFVVPFDVKGEPVRKSVAISNVVIVKDLPDTADRGN